MTNFTIFALLLDLLMICSNTRLFLLRSSLKFELASGDDKLFESIKFSLIMWNFSSTFEKQRLKY